MNTATEAQVRFIKNLESERKITAEAEAVLKISRRLWKMEQFGKEAASTVIDALLACPKIEQAKPASEPPPEGMHRFDGMIYKVQRAVHGSGNLYAKRLVLGQDEFGDTSASFEYAPGAIKSLSESTRMTLDEAKEFGALYGTCCVCGRTLTNEDSIAAGIGPVCARQF
jgi:hypothetical protein